MSQSLDPRKRFWMALPVANSDGTLDPGCEGPIGHASEAAAIAAAKNDIDDYGGEYFIFECRPLKRVCRVEFSVEDIKETP